MTSLRDWRWRRLQAQGLLSPLRTVLEAAVRSAAPSGALPRGPLALAVRVRDFVSDDLVAAVESRAVLRVPAMRGSIYLMPRELVASGLALSAPEKAKALLAKGGIDARRYAMITDRIEAVLAGRELTGAEIRAEVSGDTALEVPGGEIFTLLLRSMSHEGRIVRGFVRGGYQSQIFAYARMSDWLGDSIVVPSVDEALAMLLPWYLEAHAPATARDFAWWAGVSLRDARRALAGFPSLTLDDRPDAFYALESALGSVSESARSAQLPSESSSVVFVPHMDPFLMAHADRWLWLDPRWAPNVVAPSGDTTNALLVDGEVAGVWDIADGILRYACFVDPPEDASLIAAARRFDGMVGPLRLERHPVPPDLRSGPTFQSPFGD
jgi:hypothetical protein